MPKTATVAAAANKSGYRLVPLALVRPSELKPQQQRRAHFKPADLEELPASIRDKGLINPITVRPAAKAKEAAS